MFIKICYSSSTFLADVVVVVIFHPSLSYFPFPLFVRRLSSGLDVFHMQQTNKQTNKNTGQIQWLVGLGQNKVKISFNKSYPVSICKVARTIFLFFRLKCIRCFELKYDSLPASSHHFKPQDQLLEITCLRTLIQHRSTGMLIMSLWLKATKEERKK